MQDELTDANYPGCLGEITSIHVPSEYPCDEFIYVVFNRQAALKFTLPELVKVEPAPLEEAMAQLSIADIELPDRAPPPDFDRNLLGQNSQKR